MIENEELFVEDTFPIICQICRKMFNRSASWLASLRKLQTSVILSLLYWYRVFTIRIHIIHILQVSILVKQLMQNFSADSGRTFFTEWQFFKLTSVSVLHRILGSISQFWILRNMMSSYLLFCANFLFFIKETEKSTVLLG